MIANYTSKYAYIITTLGILFILSILVFFTYIFNKDKEYSNAIYPNVIIDNIELGGATKNDAKLIFEKKYQYIQNTQIRVQFEKENIATVSGQQLNIRTDAENLIENAYLIGRSKNIVGRLYEQASTLFGLREFTYTTTVVYETSALDKIVRSIEKKYNKPAKNALFSFENNRVVSFRQEEKGRRIKSEVLTSSIQKNITEAKNSKNPSFTVILEKEVINPEITLAKVNQFGIEELIGVGKSDYSHSIPEKVHNVLHAASKFNGVLIPPGATFSFNDTIGDITQATGYKQAYIIKSGKTVLGDGGGVCQVSTTLFRAALNTGLPIVDRTAHAYRVGYYENDSKPGFDATVFGPTVDFKLKNDTGSHILIQTVVDQENNLLTFNLFGKKDGRRTEISPVTLYDVQPPLPELRQDDPTLKKGVVKQVDFPAWGGKAVFTYKVFDSAGKEVINTRYLSSYRPWQAIYLVGTSD